VDYFYSAAKHRSRGVLWPIFTPALIAYVVRDAAGPVRVSGQWWSEANWCREEWDVRLENGTVERLCRIAFDPRSRCWYLQGTYD
jgi:protein ImuB